MIFFPNDNQIRFLSEKQQRNNKNNKADQDENGVGSLDTIAEVKKKTSLWSVLYRNDTQEAEAEKRV